MVKKTEKLSTFQKVIRSISQIAITTAILSWIIYFAIKGVQAVIGLF